MLENLLNLGQYMLKMGEKQQLVSDAKLKVKKCEMAVTDYAHLDETSILFGDTVIPYLGLDLQIETFLMLEEKMTRSFCKI